MRLTSQEVYDKLINEDRILELQGQIRFYLGDVDIIVHQKDVVGNIIQEWLQGWLEKRGIEYAPSENTQMPPDFFLNPDDLTKNLLEVKAFNRSASPGFDIADFRMYEEEIVDKPYMLHVDYLIFGYDMDENGIVTIKDLWLKKVWEITRRMKDWSINLQVKQNVVHKIRPGVWYSTQRGNYPKAGAMWKHDIFCEVGQFFRTALVYESKYALRALIGHPTGFGGVVIFFCSFAFQPFHGNIVLRRNTVKIIPIRVICS